MDASASTKEEEHIQVVVRIKPFPAGAPLILDYQPSSIHWTRPTTTTTAAAAILAQSYTQPGPSLTPRRLPSTALQLHHPPSARRQNLFGATPSKPPLASLRNSAQIGSVSSSFHKRNGLESSSPYQHPSNSTPFRCKDDFLFFDRVLGPQVTQEQLCHQSIKPLVEAVGQRGHNAIIFAYGY